MKKLYKELAGLVVARQNCIESKKDEWLDRHEDRIESLVKEHMPSGSGFDSGTQIDLEKSNREKLVFKSGYHLMDDQGGYDGWIDFTVTVRADMLFDFDVTVSGMFSRLKSQYSGHKDYIAEEFILCLSLEIEQD